MLQAIANTTFKYRESAPFFSFAKQYFSNNEVSKDLDLLLGWYDIYSNERIYSFIKANGFLC